MLWRRVHSYHVLFERCAPYSLYVADPDFEHVWADLPTETELGARARAVGLLQFDRAALALLAGQVAEALHDEKCSFEPVRGEMSPGKGVLKEDAGCREEAIGCKKEVIGCKNDGGLENCPEVNSGQVGGPGEPLVKLEETDSSHPRGAEIVAGNATSLLEEPGSPSSISPSSQVKNDPSSPLREIPTFSNEETPETNTESSLGPSTRSDPFGHASSTPHEQILLRVEISPTITWTFTARRCDSALAARFFAHASRQAFAQASALRYKVSVLESALAAKDNYTLYLEENYKTVNGSELMQKYRRQHKDDAQWLGKLLAEEFDALVRERLRKSLDSSEASRVLGILALAMSNSDWADLSAALLQPPKPITKISVKSEAPELKPEEPSPKPTPSPEKRKRRRVGLMTRRQAP